MACGGMHQSGSQAATVLDSLIDRLHERGRLRVWSVVISVFGDAIVPRGGRVGLATLQELAERLRIEPGALRTAMSRLASDHWVIRERVGRNSFFSLDRRGRHAFDLATRRIYAAGPPAWDGKWTVAIIPPGEAATRVDLSNLGFVRAGSGVHLRPETFEAPDAAADLEGMLVVHGESAEHPEAFRALWPSEAVADAYRHLIENFAPLSRAVGGNGSLRPLDAMAARTMLVHDWRRIVLRDPGLPEALMPQGWPGEDARALVRGIYAALVDPSERWLDAAGLPPAKDATMLARRFGGESGLAQSSR